MDNIEKLCIEIMQTLLCDVIENFRERFPRDGTKVEKMMHDPRLEMMARARLSVSGDPGLAVIQALKILLKRDKSSHRKRDKKSRRKR